MGKGDMSVTGQQHPTATDAPADAPLPDAFFRLFHDLPRQGPGSDAVTRSLLERVRPLLPHQPHCADMGCGNGRSSLILAETLQASLVAIDTHQPFLEELEDAARRRGLEDRIETRCRDMLDPRIKARSLDLVWSEGAAYVVGLDSALGQWRSLLKPGGLLVVSDCMWLRSNPPPEVENFWMAAYPDMRTVSESLSVAEQQGYTFLAAETLPESGWWEDYYLPLERRLETLLPMAEHDPVLAGVMAATREEIAMFRRFSDVYSYVFLILRYDGGEGTGRVRRGSEKR